jgi:hypothetical protein
MSTTDPTTDRRPIEWKRRRTHTESTDGAWHIARYDGARAFTMTGHAMALSEDFQRICDAQARAEEILDTLAVNPWPEFEELLILRAMAGVADLVDVGGPALNCPEGPAYDPRWRWLQEQLSASHCFVRGTGTDVAVVTRWALHAVASVVGFHRDWLTPDPMRYLHRRLTHMHGDEAERADVYAMTGDLWRLPQWPKRLAS